MFFLEKRTAKRLKKVTAKRSKNQIGWGGRGKLGFPTN
jgi:hypothetical protein